MEEARKANKSTDKSKERNSRQIQRKQQTNPKKTDIQAKKYTGSSRKNDKSNTVFTGTNLNKILVLSAVLG